MDKLPNLNSNKLLKAVLKDGDKIFIGIKVDHSAIELPEDLELSEHQFYIHNVGFYLVNTLTLYKQLNLAIDFLSNFDYSKKISATRADHLIYNVENYLIRLNSVYDRILQVVNAVFHLCISEENVSHSVIISNYKVRHRNKIHRKIKSIKKYLKDYEQARHTIIHKHSLLDVKLKKLKLFYLHNLKDLPENEKWKQDFKVARANYLRDYISDKKDEFFKVNDGLGELLSDLFDQLLEEYERQKDKL
jgi:hypothetical protein